MRGISNRQCKVREQVTAPKPTVQAHQSKDRAGIPQQSKLCGQRLKRVKPSHPQGWRKTRKSHWTHLQQVRSHRLQTSVHGSNEGLPQGNGVHGSNEGLPQSNGADATEEANEHQMRDEVKLAMNAKMKVLDPILWSTLHFSTPLRPNHRRHTFTTAATVCLGCGLSLNVHSETYQRVGL